MKIKVLKAFRFAEDGVTVTAYEPGVHEVPQAVADVALQEGWARKLLLRRGRKDVK